MSRVLVGFVFFLLCGCPLIASAQSLDAKGAVVQVPKVTRFPDGGAVVDFQVRQSFVGEEQKTVAPWGIGGMSIDANTISFTTQSDLEGQPFTTGEFAGRGTVSRTTLDCQAAEDRCRGCFSLGLGSGARDRKIQNVNPDNRSWNASTRFSVLSTVTPGSVLYGGPTFLHFTLGEFNVFELSPHIQYPGPVEYILRNGNYSNGLSSNPVAAGRYLRLNQETGRVHWDLRSTEGGAQIGELYAFQVIIRAKNPVNGTHCKPETAVDIVIQIGCPLSQVGVDPACFLCTEVDIASLMNQVPGKVVQAKKQVRRVRRKIFSKGRQLGFSVGLQRFLRRRFRRAFGALNQIGEGHASLVSLAGVQTSCAAKSDIFCSSSTNVPLKAPILEALQRRVDAEQSLYVAVNRGTRDIFGRRSTRRAERDRTALSRVFDEISAIVDAIPDSEDFCGTP